MSTRFDPGVIGNREVSNTGGREITQDKLWHLTKYTEAFGLAIGASPSDIEVILFQADKAGKLGDDISAAFNADGSSGSTTFDVKKNGTTILSGVITVNSSTGDRTAVAGTFASAAAQSYAVGDVLSCAMDTTSHTGAQGPMLNYTRLEQGD